MAESVFRFKQFELHQHEDVAKVGTDSVIMGSYIVFSDSVQSALEIGAGTGVISLMIAQRYPAVRIDAIDIDPLSVAICLKNFRQSAWTNQLQVYEADLRKYHSSYKYDFIFTNPPYFINGQMPLSETRKRIRHAVSLDMSQLFAAVNQLLSESGLFCLISPYQNRTAIISAAQKNGFYECSVLNIRNREEQPLIRQIITFSRSEPGTISSKEISIYGNDRKYSQKLTELLSDYLIIF
ncbi:MAG: methyltransferase [Calditrichaeota bacterium]|nr:methyltransferase [Calditrichota bacterium]